MIYAIGDVHGQLAKLDAALERIERDGAGGPVVFLGDYVDRGPDARGVIDRIARGQREGRPWIALKGNHDRMFLRFVREARVDDDFIKSGRTWLNPRLGGPMTLAAYLGGAPNFLHERGGGIDTLLSYEIDVSARGRIDEIAAEARAAVPEDHLAWIDALPLWHEAGDLLFVHAGIRPGLPLHAQTEEDLIWIRDGFTDDPAPHPWLVVHGHTALTEATHFGNRVDLDSGAGYGGPVTAAAFEDGAAYVLGETGRERLDPPP